MIEKQCVLSILCVFSKLFTTFSSAEAQNFLLPSTEVLSKMKTCPFPMSNTILPCSCRVDESFQIFLICDIDQDMDGIILQRLSDAFACKKEIYLFDIDLNGHSWVVDFSPELLGQFRITHFHLSNYTSLAGDVQPGAFNGSSFSLQTFHIETSLLEKGKQTVKTGAFSKLQALYKVDIGNSFETIQTKAFFDLPNLQLLSMDEQTLLIIETEAFDQLPKLNILDPSNQLIGYLPTRAFCNLSNITNLNLNRNMIRNVQVNTFYNLPSLITLDLSRNSDLCHLGNMLEHLQNADLAVNLAETNVKVLLQDTFKEFVERVSEKNGKGFINLSSVPLQCTCDINWLLTHNSDWKNIFQNSSCLDGIQLEEVS